MGWSLQLTWLSDLVHAVQCGMGTLQWPLQWDEMWGGWKILGIFVNDWVVKRNSGLIISESRFGSSWVVFLVEALDQYSTDTGSSVAPGRHRMHRGRPG